MSYASAGGYYNNEKFVRPAHRLVALHGADVVPVTALGLDRRPHRPAATASSSRGDIEHRDRRRLRADARSRRQGDPVVRRAPREHRRRSSKARAGDATPIMPDALLDEVTALVEWPAVYAGTFDAAFLAVPQECLILTMQQNQKYFALADDARQAAQPLPAGEQPRDAATRRRSSPATSACCARGSPTRSSSSTRTARQRLDARVAQAAQRRLSQQARHAGASASSACACSRRGSRRSIGADAAHADRAALLAKADLVTDMVGEFPELQGTDGPLLRAARRRGAARRRRDRAALLAALRRRRAARRPRSRRPSRSPTSSKRWRACSASARCPPATRIRSACAAPRSASCAS